MEHQGDRTTSTIINFAPDGDIILIVGPEMKRFRVHSLFLKAASKPFVAMFKWERQEGQDLLHQDGPKEIELPADNAAALETILAIIHHQNNEIPRNITASQVLEIAIAADKYDFLDAMKLASATFLRSDTTDANDLIRLVTAAYLFRNARAFKENTKALVLNCHVPYLDLACDEVESALGWRIFCLLETQRIFVRSEFSEILLEGINEYHGMCAQNCGWICKYAYAYLNLLKENELWPVSLHKISISDAIESAERMPDPVPQEASGECRSARTHTLPWYRDDRSWRLKSLDEKVGLCLTCVRNGYKWDTSKLDDDHDYLHGNGLLNQLGGCGTISKWKFENMTVDASNPYEWHASGQTTIWQKGCIEHAIVSAGAPAGSCSGTE
ncbi:putative btb poz domain-containing protein [Botrytis fragariae]|uniref:Putative btb poz domain-containing protein n=1 Tax=Botrytis fragariae TaxID=1964551 RepID=A0A8H6AYX7_9HELO|nr:putative btb poz domain-containing protein [Botrytis fragariae]KAF5876279.1 putative btb poz domain-containing protein [Botrytis fragariae]